MLGTITCLKICSLFLLEPRILWFAQPQFHSHKFSAEPSVDPLRHTPRTENHFEPPFGCRCCAANRSLEGTDGALASEQQHLLADGWMMLFKATIH